MHVNARKMAFMGLMMALSVIMVLFGTVLEMSTLFFLALGSFFAGIVIVENGVYIGAAFFAGSALLSFFLSPNKLYALTYAGMVLYLLLTEFVWSKLLKRQHSKLNNGIQAVIKFLIFNAMYIPILIFAPSLIITKELNCYLFIGLLVAGQVVLVIYDKAFHIFMGKYWQDMKRRLRIS